MRRRQTELGHPSRRCGVLLASLGAAAALVGCEGDTDTPRPVAPAHLPTLTSKAASLPGSGPEATRVRPPGDRAAGDAPPAAADRASPEDGKGDPARTAAAALRREPGDGGEAAAPDAGAPIRLDGGGEALARNADDPPAADDDAAQLMATMARTISDLEYNAAAGLPEPPQQNVVPSPRPWTPPPGADDNPKPTIQDVWPSQGPAIGGQRVTIRGRNLQPAQVLFGLAPARVEAVAEDGVTVTAPAASAGPVPIVVTNPDGNYAISAVPFRYYR